MYTISLKKLTYAAATFIGLSALVVMPLSASAASSTTATNQARLQLIISRGNLEIDRRLTTLNTLTSQITSATKLTSSDAATLNNEVSGDITSLTTLKAHLDSDTTVVGAISDAESIILDYRVYLLVVPQVNIVKAADDQQTAETQLSALATKLSARITSVGQSGTSVTSMQASLSSMNAQVTTAQAISSNMETSVIKLLPSDYNSNHAVLLGDRNQLLTAQADINDALDDAQNIITALASS